MKYRVQSFLFLVGMVMVLGAASAYAQTQYRAHIPFDFSIKDKVFKAGDYAVGPVSGSSNYSAIALMNRENGESSFLRGASMGPDPQARKGKLIFAVTNGEYVLTDVNTPNWNLKMKRTITRVNLVKGKAPKETIVAIHLQ